MAHPKNPILGTWKQPEGQPYAGLIFQFNEDGTFQAVYSEMGVFSAGTFIVSKDLIYLDQTQHTFGLLGKFEGRFKIDSDSLQMLLGNAGEKVPDDFSKARLYLKQ